MLCFIVSLIVGACIFLGVFYLVKSEITDLFDVLYALSFDIWVGLFGETNSPSDYKTAFEQDELNDTMIDKINELVEAVNRLEEKVNEMA